MGRVRKVLTDISKRFALPGEVVAGLPKIELTGMQSFAVEPHNGLQEYGEERISISTCLGIIVVRGKELQIAVLNSRRICIDGTIDAVEWVQDHVQ